MQRNNPPLQRRATLSRDGGVSSVSLNPNPPSSSTSFLRPGSVNSLVGSGSSTHHFAFGNSVPQPPSQVSASGFNGANGLLISSRPNMSIVGVPPSESGAWTSSAPPASRGVLIAARRIPGQATHTAPAHLAGPVSSYRFNPSSPATSLPSPSTTPLRPSTSASAPMASPLMHRSNSSIGFSAPSLQPLPVNSSSIFTPSRPATSASIHDLDDGDLHRPSSAKVVGTSESGAVAIEWNEVLGTHFVRRTEAERAASADRLNLDRRGLTSCCVVEGEPQLRLLNLENNSITAITHLNYLPNLVFLDLYNNQIKAISGLDACPLLRVLMLGKNQIRRIENLNCVPRLDVLDLHSNRLTVMEGLQNLRELRVLNLAGNTIRAVEGLSACDGLTELNLRRNAIESISAEVDRLPKLQRLFLTNNNFSARPQMAARLCSLVRSRATTLIELSLDGCPVATEPLLRESLIDACLQGAMAVSATAALRVLDGKPVSDDERRSASQLIRNTYGSAGAPFSAPRPSNVPEASVPEPLTQPAALSTGSAAPAISASGSVAALSASAPPPAVALPAADADIGSTSDRDRAEALRRIERAWLNSASSRSDPRSAPGTPVPAQVSSSTRIEDRTFYELSANRQTLSVYGPALGTLTSLGAPQLSSPPTSLQLSPALASLVSLSLKCIEHSKLADCLPLIAQLAHLKSLTFGHNHITALWQLEPFSVLSGPLVQLDTFQLAPNPICDSAPQTYQSLLLACMPQCKTLEGNPVTDSDRQKAKSMFGNLLSLWQRQTPSQSRLMRPSWMLPLCPNEPAPEVPPTEAKPKESFVIQPLPSTGSSSLKLLHSCAYLAALYLTKKVILQSQSKHRKISRTFVDKIYRGALARFDRLKQFNAAFPELVRRLIRQVICEQPVATLERILADMLLEVSAGR